MEVPLPDCKVARTHMPLLHSLRLRPLLLQTLVTLFYTLGADHASTVTTNRVFSILQINL